MKVYACYNKNEEARMKSSSGGVFTLLASGVIKENGIVYGVAMTEDCYSAEYIRVTDVNGLERLRGSKYLQAEMGNTLSEVKKDLLEGRRVLFSGTGCQVIGLKKFLQKEYENLLCVDVVCHGTPSSLLWKKYVEYQESKYGKLVDINFRCKEDSWKDFGMKENAIYISKDTDAYMQMFLRNYSLRPSCYACVAKEKKMSDISLADFWGIEKAAPEMMDGKGTSAVFVRSKKGVRAFQAVCAEMRTKEVSYEDAVKENLCEYASVKRPEERDRFYKDMEMMGFEKLKKKYAAPIRIPFTVRLKVKLRKMLQKFGERN